MPSPPGWPRTKANPGGHGIREAERRARERLSEREWARLLNMVGEGRVVPVLGPELLRVPWEGDPAARLYDLWGAALAEQRGVLPASRDGETPLLYRVANQLSVSPDMPLGDLECDVADVLEDRQWPLPQALTDLAEIDDFPLFVTTTVDHLLERALEETRGPNATLRSVSFRPGGSALECDLPADFSGGEPLTVFHLFGATSMDPFGFAATEDTLIEFSWALIDQDYAPTRLYDFLRRKHLLLLGCDFPDWLSRFLIHALTRRPDAQIGATFVSESQQVGLRDFLRRKRASLPPPMAPVDFVAELASRWRTHPRSPPRAGSGLGAPMKPGAVFISYARENKACALAIRDQLEEARIDTWMDETGLEPGVEFQAVIRESIGRASFFLAVISRALDLEGSHRPGRFVLREWKWAEDASLDRSKEHRFLQPVVVDDTPPGARFIDPPFRDLHWTQAEGGRLPPELIDLLRRGIRRFRSEAAG